jgi:succinylarginine dihydrolase
MKTIEANFDGLVGPTHNYAGLAYGNVASASNADKPSSPREAALQGLRKMQALHALGLPQGVLPPHERPHLPTLRALGFGGTDAQVLQRAHREAPGLLAAASSASAMWVANAATVSPSADTADGRVHFTPANLCAHLHRALEPAVTARILRATFADPQHFTHHAPLPATPALGDEGAANHTRLCWGYGAPGLELFTYGRGADADPAPRRYPARQTRAASEAVARVHGVDPARTFFVQQNPAVIDEGVFHNDVIAVGNREVLLYHEHAFLHTQALRDWIGGALEGADPVFIAVPAAAVSIADAVRTYLFNSQLVCTPDGAMHLVCAQECRDDPRVWEFVQDLVADRDNPIAQAHVLDLRQSMRNGGGPACLRLRVVLTEPERAAVNRACWLDAARGQQLADWIRRHYRDRLVLGDLADPALLDESRRALDELTRLLQLGSLYDFQLVLAFVATDAAMTRLRTTSWDKPLRVTVYPIAGDAHPRTREYVATLQSADFAAIGDFLQREAARHGLAVAEPVRLRLGPVLDRKPPLPPADHGLLGTVSWSLRLRWWAWRREAGQPRPHSQVRMFVLYYDADAQQALAHSTGLKEGLIGVVHAFAARHMAATNNVVIAHELLHTLGATDKYDAASGLPVYPDGFAEPERQPRYPQRAAEIMGGRVPVGPQQAEIPETLERVRVGPATAREIGWRA